jgi:hypothetical protein
MAGAFDDDIDIMLLPRNKSRILLLIDRNHLPIVDEGILSGRNLLDFPSTMSSIVLEQISEVSRRRKIVNRDNFKSFFDTTTESETANTTETINTDFY